MGLFESSAVKELKKQAELIGGICGQAQVGDLAWSDVDDVISNSSFQERLRAAFATAAAEVGDEKALRLVLRAARYSAEAPPFVRKLPKGNVEDRAEAAINQMLGREQSAERRVIPTSTPDRDRKAVLRQLTIMRDEIHRNDVEDTGLINRPKYQKAYAALVAMGEAAVPTLIETVSHLGTENRDSPDHWTRLYAVDILGKIGDPKAVPCVEAFLGKPYPQVPAALGRMQEPGVRVLLAAITAEEDFMRGQAARGLGVCTVLQHQALQALMNCLGDPSPNVREAAASSIGDLGNAHPKLIEALRYIAATDPADWVRRMAERSANQLSQLDKRPRPAAPSPAPFPADPPLAIDLAAARTVVEPLSRAAASTDAEVRAAIQHLLRASGTPMRPVDMLAAMHTNRDVRNRPWLWLAGICEHANTQAMYDITAQAFMFVSYWTHVVGPTLGAGDIMEVGLDRVPPLDCRSRLANAALMATEALPPDVVLAADEFTSITPVIVREWARVELADVQRRTGA